MSPAKPRRCGTCELLVRSTTPGLETYGKCPHRAGWVRTADAACAQHAGERPKPLVRVMLALNVVVGLGGVTALVVYDVRNGNLTTHVVVASILAFLVLFFGLAWHFDFLSEEPKYDLLEQNDPPPEEDRTPPWWLDPR